MKRATVDAYNEWRCTQCGEINDVPWYVCRLRVPESKVILMCQECGTEHKVEGRDEDGEFSP